MTEEELLGIDIAGKNVLIIGPPHSGKTWFSQRFRTPKHRLFHTDEYSQMAGYKEGLYSLLFDIGTYKGNSIVEGILGYRLLRKGVEESNYFPDIVISLKAVVHPRHMAMHYGNQTVLNEYFSMQNPKFKPQWIDYDTGK